MCCCEEKDPGGPRYSRREVIVSALASGTAVVLAGCGGGSLVSGGGGGVTQRAQTVTLNLDTASVAVEDGQKLNYLVSYTGNGLQSAYWGTQQPDGAAKEIVQALVWDTNADQGVRVKFEGRGLPSQVVNEASQAFVTCFWEADKSVFEFFQPNGDYIGGCTVTGAGPTFTVEQLADSKIAGLYVGTLSGAKDGIFSLTVGGTASRSAAGRKPTLRSTGARAAVTRANAQVEPALARIVQITSPADYPAPAKALFQALTAEYLATGKSDLFAQIVQTALMNTGLTGLYQDNGLSILRGILSTSVLNRAASDMLDKVKAGQDLVGQSVIRFEATSPGLTGYMAQNMLPVPTPDKDVTAVSGVAVSRDFGTIALSGVIDASGKFTATGTGGGNIVTLTGAAAGQTASGTWSSSGSTRAPGGSFSGNQQQVGQCQTQQNSGGQGTFTNTYDLGTCGKFEFSYDAFTIPDHVQVLNDGKTIFDTGGPVSGGQSVQLYVTGSATLVTVVVIASEDGTAWTYSVGCPQ